MKTNARKDETTVGLFHHHAGNGRQMRAAPGCGAKPKGLRRAGRHVAVVGHVVDCQRCADFGVGAVPKIVQRRCVGLQHHHPRSRGDRTLVANGYGSAVSSAPIGIDTKLRRTQ